jgi:hypothetical protein
MLRSRCGPRWAPAGMLPDHYSVPAEATIRRALAHLDADALATTIGTWLADRKDPGQRRQAVAVAGKTLRAPDVLAGRSTCWR